MVSHSQSTALQTLSSVLNDPDLPEDDQIAALDSFLNASLVDFEETEAYNGSPSNCVMGSTLSRAPQASRLLGRSQVSCDSDPNVLSDGAKAPARLEAELQAASQVPCASGIAISDLTNIAKEVAAAPLTPVEPKATASLHPPTSAQADMANETWQSNDATELPQDSQSPASPLSLAHVSPSPALTPAHELSPPASASAASARPTQGTPLPASAPAPEPAPASASALTAMHTSPPSPPAATPLQELPSLASAAAPAYALPSLASVAEACAHLLPSLTSSSSSAAAELPAASGQFSTGLVLSQELLAFAQATAVSPVTPQTNVAIAMRGAAVAAIGAPALDSEPADSDMQCVSCDREDRVVDKDLPMYSIQQQQGGVIHMLHDALMLLCQDPNTNIGQLSIAQHHLQSSPAGQHHTTVLALHLADILPSCVFSSRQGAVQIQHAQLQALFSRSEDNHMDQADSTAEEGRIGLALLMIALWAHKLLQQLKPHMANGSNMSDTHFDGSQMAAAGVSNYALPSAYALNDCMDGKESAASLTSQRATSSAALPAAATKAATEAAARFSPWADHMSLLASDVGEEDADDAMSDDVSMASETAARQAMASNAEPPAATVLRRYQQQALDKIRNGGNWIVVAPTGSGKTRIAVELAGVTLQRNEHAKVVFLAPTVALAEQQADLFKRAPCMVQQCVTVQCFTKSSTLTPKRWRISINIASVLVMTAQQLLNNLAAGVANFSQIALLVLDECHHCLKETPYNQIMKLYKSMMPQQQANTQVLGLTASPGGDIDVEGAVRVQWQLQTNMCAQFHRIDPNDVEVARLVPRASDRALPVEPRPQDGMIATCTAHVVLRHIEGLVTVMLQLMPEIQPPEEKTKLDLAAGKWSPELKAWFRSVLDPSKNLSSSLTAYLQLLRDCNTAVLLMSDYGFEVGLQNLAVKCMQASQQSIHQGGRDLPDGQHDSSEPGDVLTALLWDLAGPVFGIQAVSQTTSAIRDSSHVEFPKFKALAGVLQDMVSKKDQFHGIVFVRQRQGVHAVANFLRNMPQLAAKVQFHTFTGHAARTKTQLMREGADHHDAGMATSQQQQALQDFKHANGREILVATAAAQEGLDIVNCSFVICYNVTECGMQLMQWRGRTRMFDSQILMIMEAGSSDESLYRKACVEETNDRLAQLHLADMQ